MAGTQRTYAPWPVWRDSTTAKVKFAPVKKKDAVKWFHKARQFERQTRQPGKQDGALGRNGLAVLHTLIFDILNYATGRLDPALDNHCPQSLHQRQQRQARSRQAETMGPIALDTARRGNPRRERPLLSGARHQRLWPDTAFAMAWFQGLPRSRRRPNPIHGVQPLLCPRCLNRRLRNCVKVETVPYRPFLNPIRKMSLRNCLQISVGL